MTDSRVADGDALGRVRLHLQQSAHRYFEGHDFDEVDVTLQHPSSRARATLYFFRLTAGARHLDVVVKVPLLDLPSVSGEASREGGDFPRLGVILGPEERSELERSILTAIYEAVEATADPRFGAIRLLGAIENPAALVMEKAEGVLLRDLLVKRSFGRDPSDGHDLGQELESTGAWLSHYHGAVASERASPRRSTRKDFLASVCDLTAYLGRARSKSAFFEGVFERIEELAPEILPAELPLGLGHGDFAPRNVLVQSSSRITVFDTLGRWLTPICDDIGYFLMSLRSLGPQIVSLGHAFDVALLDRYEHRFLRGYFGNGVVPLKQIRLFEIEALLARWASSTHGARESSGFRWLRLRTELAARERLFGTWIRHQLKALE